MDSQTTMSQLIELDRGRRNAQLAASALREAARWSELVREIEEVVESKDFNQLCANIEGMESCLAALTYLPDYKERVSLVETHKNSLESLLAPQLMQEFNRLYDGASDLVQSMENLRHLIELFYRIGRGEAAVNYFTCCLKTQIQWCWDRSTGAENQSRNLSVSVLHTIEELILLTESVSSEFGQSLPGVVENRTRKCRQFATFVGQLMHIGENQFNTVLFPSDHHAHVVRALANSIEAIQDRMVSFVHEPWEPDAVPRSLCRVDGITTLLRITKACYTALVASLETHYKAMDVSETDSHDMLTALKDLARSLAIPFKHMSSVFAKQCRLRFAEQLDAIQLVWDNPTDVNNSPSSVLIHSVQLFTQAATFCLEETHGICLPPLLDAIQTYWEGLTAKWLDAIEQFGKLSTNLESNGSYSQTSFLTSALQLASITGELSSRADMFVDNLLVQSSECLSELVGAGNGPNSSKVDASVLLQQLALIQPEIYQKAFHCLANSSYETTQSGLTAEGFNESHTHTTYCRLSAVHRANVRLCRAGVTMVRRIALAPMRRLLDQVPQLTVWHSTPSSGESRLPDLAYLPQDYMTQIGQYLLALPESFEPYMDLDHSSLENGVTTLDATNDLISNRGLTECLRLGDSDTVTATLTSRLSDHPGDDGLKGPTQRKRLTSHSQLMASSRKSGENANSAAVCWLETLISGLACDMLVNAILKIGSSMPEHPNIGSTRSNRTDEVDDVAVLTEHGAKQLQVDLDYFRNLLDDLGLPLTGSLKALCELMQCPLDDFAELSASRPPRIVNSIAKLRGI